MISEAKLAANRRNAQVSTGPKTGEGKARSSQNSLKHGLSAKRPLIPGENEADHEAFRKEIRDAFRPPGALETLLVERIINAAWRLRRFGPIEAQILSGELEDVLEQFPEKEETALGFTFLRTTNGSQALARLHRYEMGLERSLYRAHHTLKELQAPRGQR